MALTNLMRLKPKTLPDNDLTLSHIDFYFGLDDVIEVQMTSEVEYLDREQVKVLIERLNNWLKEEDNG